MAKMNYLYAFAQWFFWLSFKTFWRMKIYGHKNIPQKGGVIVAANHISLFDPPVVGSAMERQAYYMAKEELFRIPIFGRILRKVNAFPVRRGETDFAALKRMLAVLKEGKAVILFPEGTRSRGDDFLRGKPGIGMLAVHTGVPVVPAFIRNTNRLSHFLPLEVHFAQPVHFSNSKDKEYYQRIADQIMEKISELKKNSEEKRQSS